MSCTVKTMTVCFDEMLLCFLQIKLGLFVQPYEGWWVSYTTNTMTIGLDEMLLWLFYRITKQRQDQYIYIRIDNSQCFTYISSMLGVCVQPYEGWWLSRSLAREQVHKLMGDTGMMDYMLKAIANRTVGPWAVFRCRCLHCLSCSLICPWLCPLLCSSHCPLLCPLLCPSLCPPNCPLLLPFWPHPLPPLPLLPVAFALLTTPSPFIASLALHCLPPLSRSSLKTFAAFRCVLSFSCSSLNCLSCRMLSPVNLTFSLHQPSCPLLCPYIFVFPYTCLQLWYTAGKLNVIGTALCPVSLTLVGLQASRS